MRLDSDSERQEPDRNGLHVR